MELLLADPTPRQREVAAKLEELILALRRVWGKDGHHPWSTSRVAMGLLALWGKSRGTI